MTNELKIEHYLLQLDRELQALLVSQRAEIITEIKSHIHEALEKTPSRTLEQILADLGSPRAVAEPYLAAKGFTPSAASGRPRKVLKWLAVATVAFFGLIFVSGLMLMWYLSPLIRVDEERGRVTLLGGLIDVNEDLGQVKIGDMVVSGAMKDSVKVEGEEAVDPSGVRGIRIPFNTAKIEITQSPDRRLTWSCRAATERQPQVHMESGILTLNLDVLSLAKCEIRVPTGAPTELRGVNGHLDVDLLGDDVSIDLDNGKVRLHPDPSKVYDFEVHVKNGLQDFFPRSQKKDAVKVKVSVVNGLVKKE